MEEKIKYSTAPALETMEYLVLNGIPFFFCKGAQSRKNRLFFVSLQEDAIEMRKSTGFIAYEETEGDWDFDNWDALINQPTTEKVI